MQLEGRNLKKSIQSGEIAIGTILNIPSPAIIEILGYAGFDYVMIDTEHAPIGPLDTAVIENLTRAANLADITPLVRVNKNDPGMVSKVLDAGAMGVVAPHVKTKEETIRLVKGAKYPPIGVRGAMTLSRATRYGSRYDEGY